jgi:hypothetical protein
MNLQNCSLISSGALLEIGNCAFVGSGSTSVLSMLNSSKATGLCCRLKIANFKVKLYLELAESADSA